ncbi:hypothetical protein BGZ75_001274 [Mortierella antarctica]|nr:hypothetical protein BGZ75_001274 [Mortierella antarctica]
MHEGTHHTEPGDADFIRKLRVDLNLIDQRVLGVEQQLKAFIEEMAPRRNDGRRSEWAEVTFVELVRDEIPPHLAVVKEPGTRIIRIPAEFWHGVRKLLAAGIQDGRTTISNDSQQEATLQGEEAEGGSHTWDGFLEENAMALQNLVDERIAVYSRDQFLDLVRTETRMIWTGIENRMLDRLARFRCGPDCSSTESAAKAKNEILWELTSRAVDEHPADVLDKPDFALYNAGGRVIPELTFMDYVRHKHDFGIKTWPRRILAGLIYSHSFTTRLAEKAIQPSMHAGDCWAMNGSLGDGQSRAGRREPEKLHHSPIKGTWWKEGSPCPGASQLTAFEYKAQTQYGSDRQQLDQRQRETPKTDNYIM